MGTYAKAFLAVSAVARRFVNQRVNRHLDDRDFTLRDAIKILEKRSSGVYPTILSVSAALASITPVSPQTGLTLTGVNFIGDATKSTGTTDSGVANKAVVWTANRPGEQTISLVLVDTGAESVVSVTASVITVNIDGVGNTSTTTATALAALIAAHATAKSKITGVANGTGLGVVTAQTVSITGGTGSLPSLSIGAQSVDDSAGFGITGYTDTLITFNFDAAAFTAGQMKQLFLTVDDVRCEPIDIFVGGPGNGAYNVALEADPGTGVAIPVTASGYVPLTIGSAGAETNTLAAPTFVGQKKIISVDVVGTGTRVITVATAFNQAAQTIMTFAQARDCVVLEAIKVGGALRWVITGNDGVALS